MEERTVENKGRKGNRLLNEKSPYLRQHAHNPVDWYPWGEEAFQRAKDEDRPVFLSIGYSSCHWCHVMEQESFEDEEVAHILNENFVPVKVDREERPDLDATYMTMAQLITGQGGWPLTLVLTPDKKPFFATTYMPKEAKQGMIGLTTFLPMIIEFWKTRRGEIETTSEKVLAALKDQEKSTGGGGLGEETLMDAFQHLMEEFDESYGGFGSAPKFPTPHRLTFLLRYWNRNGDDKSLWMTDHTLQAMRRGGMFDQLGKGFHRYSTDRTWLVPHFEKMLYDQALLAMAYVEGWQATGNEEHARTAREVLDSVLENMTSPQGGFYSALDADSEGEEGKYYFWTEEEVRKILEPEEVTAVQRELGLSREGNVREGEHGHLRGKNVLHVTGESTMPSELLARAMRKMLLARRQRAAPALDDKILADWNGLMIAAFSRAGAALDEPRYVLAAKKAASFVLDELRSTGGSLLHIYRDGPSDLPGFLDDHAFMAWGLLELFQADQDVRWLLEARSLVRSMNERFWDAQQGGHFQAYGGDAALLHRRKDVYDGALPSGNSIALLDLLLLYRLTEEPDLLEKADRTITAFSGAIFRSPANYAQFLNAVDLRLGPSYSIVIAGIKGGEDTGRFFQELGPHFVPNKVTLLVEPGEPGDRIRELSPLVQGQAMRDGKAMAHVCTDRACLPETADPEAFARLLRPA
jgi:uncharacterized protein